MFWKTSAKYFATFLFRKLSFDDISIRTHIHDHIQITIWCIGEKNPLINGDITGLSG